MNIQYLGLDIGGAHVKAVGLNNEKKIVLVEYFKCYFWNKAKEFLNVVSQINKYINKKTLIGITMTAELCDTFENRKQGFRILSNYCKYLKNDFFFYSSGNRPFIKNAKYNDVISMNWHAIGRYVVNHVSNCIIVDFGSTTTDFICIKNDEIKNIHFDDFSRLNNSELLYSGLIRTPIFSVTNEVRIDDKVFVIIPEMFSNMADVYRINKTINLYHDIDDTTDLRSKSYQNSLCRVSRNFGIDYNKSMEKFIIEIAKNIAEKQLSIIEKFISVIRKKYDLKSGHPIITSGVGKDVLIELLKPKNYKLLPLDYLIRSDSDKLKKEAAFHAPAFSIAYLLSTIK